MQNFSAPNSAARTDPAPMLPYRLLLLAALLLAVTTAHAEGAPEAAPAADLEKQTRSLKQATIDLRGKLLAVERDVRIPAPDRWTVFLTASEMDEFELTRLTLSVNGSTVTQHRYSNAERRALAEGGAHRLHLSTLGLGQHRVAANIIGRRDGESFQRRQTFTVNKPDGPRLMQLRLAPRVEAGDGRDGPGLTVRHLDDLP